MNHQKISDRSRERYGHDKATEAPYMWHGQYHVYYQVCFSPDLEQKTPEKKEADLTRLSEKTKNMYRHVRVSVYY